MTSLFIDKPIRGKKLSHHIELRVKPEEQHYWSPVLNITFDKAANGTVVRGRFLDYFYPYPKKCHSNSYTKH